MIRIEGLRKTYEKGGERLVVLDGIDFTIAEGAFVMVLGESGSGKTTLLNLLGCLDRADAGRIVVEGVGDLLTLPDRVLSHYRNRFVGHVYQTFNLKGIYTAFENVRVPLLFTRLSPRQIEARVMGALDEVGLAARADFRPIELSEGQCQRVAIARAIVTEPRLLLADEPTGNLDPKTAVRIMDLLLRLNRERKMTLVMVTHDMSVLEYADSVVLLADGTLRPLSAAELSEFTATHPTVSRGTAT